MKPKKAVLLDTSFFIRFLNDEDPLFNNADRYFRQFLNKEIVMFISTISVAEYCVGGTIDELPLRNLRILPFNLNHGTITGKFARIAFEKRRNKKLKVKDRVIIPNDTKLFAQAHLEKDIIYYLSADSESQKVFQAIKEDSDLGFTFIDLNTSPNEFFGELDLL